MHMEWLFWSDENKNTVKIKIKVICRMIWNLRISVAQHKYVCTPHVIKSEWWLWVQIPWHLSGHTKYCLFLFTFLRLKSVCIPTHDNLHSDNCVRTSWHLPVCSSFKFEFLITASCTPTLFLSPFAFFPSGQIPEKFTLHTSGFYNSLSTAAFLVCM